MLTGKYWWQRTKGRLWPVTYEALSLQSSNPWRTKPCPQSPKGVYVCPTLGDTVRHLQTVQNPKTQQIPPQVPDPHNLEIITAVLNPLNLEKIYCSITVHRCVHFPLWKRVDHNKEIWDSELNQADWNSVLPHCENSGWDKLHSLCPYWFLMFAWLWKLLYKQQMLSIIVTMLLASRPFHLCIRLLKARTMSSSILVCHQLTYMFNTKYWT